MVVEKIIKNEIIGRMSHPDKVKYPNQHIFIMELNEYHCYIPFIENDEEIFLKTIIPSRKLKKAYRSDGHGKN